MTTPMTPEQLDPAARLATQLRVDSIRCSTQAGSGHPTSPLSAADLMAVLMLGHLHYDWHQPDLPANDHLIFSKGHASPLLYPMFRAAGVIDENELIKTYRQTRLRTPGAAHRFLAVFSVISPHFRPRRHRLTADDYRTEVADRFATWNDITRSSEAA